MSQRLKEIPWKNRGSRNRAKVLRTVKMLYAACDSCGDQGYGWWENCPHDKYHHTAQQQIKTPEIGTDAGTGEQIVTGEKVKIIYHRQPNTREVPLTQRVGNGMEVERALVLGAKFPQDTDPYPPGFDGEREFDGYAPMCEFRGCYQPNPSITVRHPSLLEENPFIPKERAIAHYCSEKEAKETTFKERGVTREVFNKKARNRQYEELSIR